uniref:Uncharacterized protein n=1 Tax=Anguilla anguilla TaxID=7936 RepID=A0A0E9UWY3_ANGAN
MSSYESMHWVPEIKPLGVAYISPAEVCRHR